MGNNGTWVGGTGGKDLPANAGDTGSARVQPRQDPGVPSGCPWRRRIPWTEEPGG